MSPATPRPGLEAFVDLKPDGLPGVLRLIGEQVSMEVAIRLARSNFGGQRSYIPANPTNNHPLSMAIGVDNAKRIGQLLGSGEVEIPSARPVLRCYEARYMRRQGFTCAQIAGALGLSDGRTRALCRGIAKGTSKSNPTNQPKE